VLRYCEVPSPVGILTLAGDETALREIHFPKGSQAARGALGEASDPESVAPLREAAAQLERYFAGQLSRFDVPLALAGTPFQQECWSMLRTVPYGQTISYGELARRIGRPAAFRAVGAANGSNPIPIIVPCHRVIGSNGSLTGFGGGLSIKRHLLQLEMRHRAALEPDSPRDLWEMTAAESLSAK
jgi:methylated-DNA-[protein]-cysteine S-methyltransferase